MVFPDGPEVLAVPKEPKTSTTMGAEGEERRL